VANRVDGARTVLGAVSGSTRMDGWQSGLKSALRGLRTVCRPGGT